MSKNTGVIIFKEGYWNNSDKDYPELPVPIAKPKPWFGKGRFLKALRKVQGKATGNRYKGYSKCRLCGCKNGNSDYSIAGWVWPEGFMHYVQQHNVRPSTAFIDLILHIGEEPGKKRDD